MRTHNDLANHHKLISDLFPSLLPRDAWERYKLSDDQIDFFNTNGFISGIKMLDVQHVEHLLKDLEVIKEPDNPKNHLFYEVHKDQSNDCDAGLFHSLGHWRITTGFHDVLWNPAFVVVASQLLGNKAVRFWYDLLYCKPANHGVYVPWHQDYSYWGKTIPMQHLTCWVALDDVSKDNGCLYYIPKSHNWGLLEKPNAAGGMDALMQTLTSSQRKQFDEKVAIEMESGYACFHHPLMVHGSYENMSPRPRRAFVLNVFADGTYSDTDGQILRGVPKTRKGQPLKGKFFPLLFDPKDL